MSTDEYIRANVGRHRADEHVMGAETRLITPEQRADLVQHGFPVAAPSNVPVEPDAEPAPDPVPVGTLARLIFNASKRFRR